MVNMLIEHWFWLLVAAVVVALVGLVAVLSKYVRLMLNIIRDGPAMPFLAESAGFQRLEGKTVIFRSYDGTTLRGMFLEGAGSAAGGDGKKSAGMIIFCHEYGADMYRCSRYCRKLLEAGFDIFTFDFRGHGRSSRGQKYKPQIWCTDREVADCLGALTIVRSELRRKGQADLGVGMFGISRGAAAAVIAAHSKADARPVGAVVVDGLFSNDMLLEHLMKKWVHVFARVRFVYEHHPDWFWRFLRATVLYCAKKRFCCLFPSVRKTLAKLPRIPIFFIQGKKDLYIPSEHAVELSGRCRGRRRKLWLVPKARHNQSVALEPEEYGQRVVEFFEKYLDDDHARPIGSSKRPDGQYIISDDQASIPKEAHRCGGLERLAAE